MKSKELGHYTIGKASWGHSFIFHRARTGGILHCDWHSGDIRVFWLTFVSACETAYVPRLRGVGNWNGSW